MELSEAIEHFKRQLQSVTAAGDDRVEIANLERYLDELSKHAGISAEYRRQLHENSLAQYHATSRSMLENFKVVIDAGKEAVNAAIIINGGAAIALLAFMGNAGSKGGNLTHQLAFPVLILGLGVFGGGVAFGTRYLCQFFYANERTQKVGHIFNGLSWLLTLGSFVSFAAAVTFIYRVFAA